MPERAEARRIVFHLKHPEATVTPPWLSANGRWILRYRSVDLESATLAELMDEAEDFEALDLAARGITWDLTTLPGELMSLAVALIIDRMQGIDSRSKLPRSCWLRAPVAPQGPGTYPQRVAGRHWRAG